MKHNLTKHLAEERGGVTLTVVIQHWPQTQQAHSTKDGMGGGEMEEEGGRGSVIMKSHS